MKKNSPKNKLKISNNPSKYLNFLKTDLYFTDNQFFFILFFLGSICIVLLYIFSSFNYFFLKILLIIKILFFFVIGLIKFFKKLYKKKDLK